MLPALPQCDRSLFRSCLLATIRDEEGARQAVTLSRYDARHGVAVPAEESLMQFCFPIGASLVSKREFMSPTVRASSKHGPDRASAWGEGRGRGGGVGSGEEAAARRREGEVEERGGEGWEETTELTPRDRSGRPR